MTALFSRPESREMNANLLNRLITLVEEAREPEVSALANTLHNPTTKPSQHFAILECLKTVGTPLALEAVEKFIRKRDATPESLERARQIVREKHAERIPLRAEKVGSPFKTLVKSFHNPLEYNAEYILIRSGTMKYSATKKIERVPNLYFAKYPVTNKQYRRFIRYLLGEETELDHVVPQKVFAEKLLEFTSGDKAYSDYISRDAKTWPEKFKSIYDENRKFNSEDQPVVSVSWYACRAYCFWLSVLEAAQYSANLNTAAQQLAGIFRLPQEVEWECAAGGRREDGPPREYPWPAEKGEPNDKLANYGGNVGQTTPVTRYPEGATPEGLMDMAGNVWEWQENWYDEKEKTHRAVRGGSWSSGAGDLQGATRGRGYPLDRGGVIGFRVVRAQSFFDTL